MIEQNQLIRPLEEVFDDLTVKNLKNCGVEGVIPVEVSMEDLIAIARSKGYVVDGVYSHPSKQIIEMFWAHPYEGNPAVAFFAKPQLDGKTVYVLADEFERFKELFLGEE